MTTPLDAINQNLCLVIKNAQESRYKAEEVSIKLYRFYEHLYDLDVLIGKFEAHRGERLRCGMLWEWGRGGIVYGPQEEPNAAWNEKTYAWGGLYFNLPSRGQATYKSLSQLLPSAILNTSRLLWAYPLIWNQITNQRDYFNLMSGLWWIFKYKENVGTY